MLLLLNAALFAWLLLDPTNVPESTSASPEKRSVQNPFIEEDLQSKPGEPPASAISTSQVIPPTVSAVQDVDPPPNGLELVNYRDFKGVVGHAFPNLAISIHTYTAEPSERTVHIGGTMWREGDEIHDGMTLQAITENGIEVSYHGYLVLLDVLELWNSID
tara:strand:+ start:206 stop:688 length:483 start_codon:yes stop_codon:yes gene_type:complete